MDTSLSVGRKSAQFIKNWDIAEIHMPAIRKILSGLPVSYFLDINIADVKRDVEQATDLYLELKGGCLAIRVRRLKFLQEANHWGFDWSVRFTNNGHRTEIDKLRAGFGDWYFYAYSSDDRGGIARWWLLDLRRIRELNILDVKLKFRYIDDEYWKGPHDNHDGTSGIYYPLLRLGDLGCVIAKGADVQQDVQLEMNWNNHA